MQALTRWRRPLLKAGIALVWMGALAIPLGESLARHSSRFPAYRQEVVDEWARSNADGPSPFAFENGNEFARLVLSACFTTFIGVIYVVGLYNVRLLREDGTLLGWCASSTFSIGCLLGSALGLVSAWDSLRWGFVVHSFGMISAALGLSAGALLAWWDA
jgi:hypothetical protein